MGPVVGKAGMLNIQLVKGVRDIKGRMCKVQLGFYAVTDTNYPYLSVGDEAETNHDQAAQIADQSQYTCFMENISYPRYLGKSMKIEPDHRLSSCRIEIRPNKSSRTTAAQFHSPPKAPTGLLADRRGDQTAPPSRRPAPPKPSANPKRRRLADLLNRSSAAAKSPIRNNP